MMQFTLAIPSLFWPHTHAALPALTTPGLNGLCRWGQWYAESISTSALYSRYLWTQPPADAARQQLKLAADTVCLLCSPVSQHIGMHQASFIDGGDLALDSESAAAFCAVLNAFFHDDGWHFLPWQASRWVVTMPQLPVWSAPSLLDLDGVIDGSCKPEGVDANVLLQRQTEIQMLLYQHPLNQARQQQGLPPINGVWLENGLAGNAAAQPVLLNDDTWAGSSPAYRHAGLADDLFTDTNEVRSMNNQILFFSTLRDAVSRGDALAYQYALQEADSRWFTPLLHALRQRRLQQLTMVTDGVRGGCLKVRKPWLPPFWRPARAFSGAAL